MSTYKINYEQIRQNPLISSLLTDLEEGFAKFGLDYYLVGATARDVWMFIPVMLTPVFRAS
jgi:hypothetical protein